MLAAFSSPPVRGESGANRRLAIGRGVDHVDAARSVGGQRPPPLSALSETTSPTGEELIVTYPRPDATTSTARRPKAGRSCVP